jgi:hypothetical protein
VSPYNITSAQAVTVLGATKIAALEIPASFEVPPAVSIVILVVRPTAYLPSVVLNG